MHVKTPVYCDKAYVEAKEQKLKEFIRSGSLNGKAEELSVLLLVRSSECLAVRTLVSMSESLARAGYSAKIIFATATAAASWGALKSAFDPAFVYEARVLHDYRFLDGHEQLVCGSDHVWFGDSMRREPDKRDAYSSFNPSNAEMASRARMTFARIWEVAEPANLHDQPVGPVTADAVSGAIAANSLAAEIVGTLSGWTPTDRH